MSKPEILLVDLDGTVANCDHRKRYIDDVIRVGDTVYFKGLPNSKDNPGVVRSNLFSDGGVEFFDIRFKYPLHQVTNQVNEALFCSLSENLRKKRDYKRFFESCKDDSPIQTTIDIVTDLSSIYRVMFMSGRPDSCRQDTTNWIGRHMAGLRWPRGCLPEQQTLFMRQSGDMRQDYIVKEELYRKHIEPFYTVKLILDDRDQVVNMWRNTLGLTCWQVAPGAF